MRSLPVKWMWMIGLVGAGVIVLIYVQSTNDIMESSPIGVIGSPLFGQIIVLDPGHGGADGGAVSRDGLVEKDVTLPIALHLRDLLQQAGAFVVMTRETDEDLASDDAARLGMRKEEDLQNRVRFVREQEGTLLVSIHLNSITSPRWRGAQTFYNPRDPESKLLAESIQAELIRNLENTDRLAKANQDLYILKHTDTPGAIVEVGFLSNPDEARLLGSDEYQKKLAASIYTGILLYFSEEEEDLLGSRIRNVAGS